MKIDQMPSHRDFYTAHLVQAFEFYLEERTPELAWMLVEDLGLARLFGVKMIDVLNHLEQSPEVRSSQDKLNIIKDILQLEAHPQSILPGLKNLLYQVFEYGPFLNLNKVIEDYLENLEYKIMDEWEESDDDIIIYHTGTVVAYQWLSETITQNEDLLPVFINDLNSLGTMITSVAQTIRAQIHDFLAGQPIARFMYEGAIKDYLTPNLIFLSNEFLSIKDPDFVLALPLEFGEVYIPPQTVIVGVGEPREPSWKEGLDDWSKTRKHVPDAFIISNYSPDPYIPPSLARSRGMPAHKGRKAAKQPKIEGNYFEMGIFVPADGKNTRLLPPESNSESLSKLKELLRYSKRFDEYYYAVLTKEKGAVSKPRTAKALPREKNKPAVEDVPPTATTIIIGLHPEKDTLNKVMNDKITNKDLRKEHRIEVFLLSFWPIFRK